MVHGFSIRLSICGPVSCSPSSLRNLRRRHLDPAFQSGNSMSHTIIEATPATSSRLKNNAIGHIVVPFFCCCKCKQACQGCLLRPLSHCLRGQFQVCGVDYHPEGWTCRGAWLTAGWQISSSLEHMKPVSSLLKKQTGPIQLLGRCLVSWLLASGDCYYAVFPQWLCCGRAGLLPMVQKWKSCPSSHSSLSCTVVELSPLQRGCPGLLPLHHLLLFQGTLGHSVERMFQHHTSTKFSLHTLQVYYACTDETDTFPGTERVAHRW